MQTFIEWFGLALGLALGLACKFTLMCRVRVWVSVRVSVRISVRVSVGVVRGLMCTFISGNLSFFLTCLLLAEDQIVVAKEYRFDLLG